MRVGQVVRFHNSARKYFAGAMSHVFDARVEAIGIDWLVVRDTETGESYAAAFDDEYDMCNVLRANCTGVNGEELNND